MAFLFTSQFHSKKNKKGKVVVEFTSSFGKSIGLPSRPHAACLECQWVEWVDDIQFAKQLADEHNKSHAKGNPAWFGWHPLDWMNVEY